MITKKYAKLQSMHAKIFKNNDWYEDQINHFVMIWVFTVAEVLGTNGGVALYQLVHVTAIFYFSTRSSCQ